MGLLLTFVGTRGNIQVRSRCHRWHTSTIVSCCGERVMIDCGADWLHRADRLKPSAIVLTHAHPDHADGLMQGAPCVVHAPPPVWERIRQWPIPDRRILRSSEPVKICGMVFEPVPVDHSLRAPAVGYRITHGRAAVFYVPDVLDIPERQRALNGVTLYVGDGASVRRPIQRRQNGRLVGHAPMIRQIDWCTEAGVSEAIFTHCGTGVVTNARAVASAVAALGQARGVATRIANDGLKIVVDS